MCNSQQTCHFPILGGGSAHQVINPWIKDLYARFCQNSHSGMDGHINLHLMFWSWLTCHNMSNLQVARGQHGIAASRSAFLLGQRTCSTRGLCLVYVQCHALLDIIWCYFIIVDHSYSSYSYMIVIDIDTIWYYCYMQFLVFHVIDRLLLMLALQKPRLGSMGAFGKPMLEVVPFSADVVRKDVMGI